MEYKKMSDYPYHFGFKTRIYPSHKQKRIIHLNSQATYIMYNKLIAINDEIFELEKLMKPSNVTKLHQKQPFTTDVINNDPNTHYSYQTRCILANFEPYINRLQYLYSMRNNVSNIAKTDTTCSSKEYDSHVGAYAYKSYQLAWKNYKNGLQNKPRFHDMSLNPYVDKYQTYVNPRVQTVFPDSTHIKLPKLKQIRCDKLRDILLTKSDWASGTIAVSKDVTNKYWISVQLGSQTPFVAPKPKTNTQVGVDLNLDNFATDSRGNVIENPRYFVQQQDRLARMQHILSRKYERAIAEGRDIYTDKSYQKLRKKVAKVTRKVFNQRESFLQKLTSQLVQQNDVIVAEDLQSHNMLKNHNLAKAIQDVGWRKFLTMVKYKCEMYNKQFVTVNPRLTTQTCSNCGYILDKDKHERLTLKDREWTCPQCNYHHIRDHNAAKNILTKGLNQLKESE